ncbi:sugar phosphate nucleotidyltransferase [Ammonicoccus fulvus]|uniref:Sugar phosphate nucleotidyltransferase n=1 Tax=Ammonicoccus fulvus TaxID=3138240 RepID=A0ABZ3FSS3_9ACTN
MTRLDRVLGIVQAGGKGSRLDVLTRERAKPVLPFGGEFQLIDFALSSLTHSKIPDVWVDVAYQASTLQRHLAGGRPWDLDRTDGGFRLLAPENGDEPVRNGFAEGNADALLKIWRQIEQQRPELVVVLSADHVFRLDLRDVIDLHRDRGAECTVVTADVSSEEAAQNAVLTVTDGRVTHLDYKPESTTATTVCTEITVYDAQLLGEALASLHSTLQEESDDAEDSGLGDFGEHLLPWFVDRGKAYAFPITSYWRDVGRPEAYLGAHRDLLAGRIDVFDDPEHPVRTRHANRVAARFADGCVVADSHVSGGAVVRGTVRRSVLGPGVVVGTGAVVEDSVIMADTVIEANASVITAIVDERCVIGRGARVGAQPKGTRPRPDDLCLIGTESRVTGTLPPGSRLEPGTTA